MEQKAIDIKAADNVRLLAAAMVEKAKSGLGRRACRPHSADPSRNLEMSYS